MPTPLHQAFITVLHRHLDCALAFARVAGVPLELPLDCWRAVHTEFADPGNPGNVYLADIALIAVGPDGSVAQTLILEPQLHKDPHKYLSWPIYLVGMHTRYHCPGSQIVLGPTNRVLYWAEHELFPKQPHFVPRTVGCGDVRAILDDATAAANPAWAAIVAALHARGPLAVPTAQIALRACARFPASERGCYVQLVTLGLSEQNMNQLEPWIPEELDEDGIGEYEREGAIYIRTQRRARQEGLQEGLQEGRQEGLHEGESRGLLRVLVKRRIALTDEQRTRILTCTDLDQLDRWLDRALEVDRAEDLFAP